MRPLYYVSRFFTCLVLVGLWLCHSAYAEYAGAGNSFDVTIVLSETGGVYGEFGEALRKALGNNGLTPMVMDASRPIPNSGLVVGVGMKAASAAAASNAPVVLNVLVPKTDHEKLLLEFPRRANAHAISAIFLDQPVYRQAHLIHAVLPDRRTVGLLSSSPPEELVELRRALAVHGMKLNEQAVNSAHPLADALQNILNGSEVLLALPDAAVYNSTSIRNILLATYRSNVPLIGISSGYVKAGALGAVISTPTQIAAQAAALIGQFANTHTLPAAQYPQEFEVLVNERVARSLGVQVKSSAALHEIIRAAERSERHD